MNRIILLAIFIATSFGSYAQHDFTFKIDGLSDTTVYLANYFGGKMYYNDTAMVDSKGVVKFQGQETKPGGIYALIFPDNKTYFQVVVNEPVIEMETRLVNPEGNMNVLKSEENTAFYEYLNFVMEVQSKLAMYKSEGEVADEKEKIKVDEKIKKEQARAETFKANYLKKYEQLFAAKVLRSSDEVNVPEFKKEDGSMDDTKRFAYYHDHFFDNVDLADDRMIRTPIINGKIETYLTKLTVQTPDSICDAIQYLTSQTADSSLMYKYIVQFSTNHFEKSEIMGMDAVFICISENYYAKGKAWWLNDKQLEDIMKMYNTRKNLVVGIKADNIILMDQDSNWRSLYDVKAKYTVLVFWSPTCGHCKKEMPKLKEFYDEWKSKGVEVYSVSTEFDNKDWPKFIKDNGFTWIDVSDNPEINKNAPVLIRSGITTLNSLNFRDYWDIYSTPQYYLLDENKMIIAKRINSEQLPGFIEMYEKRIAAEKEAAK
tara:strand:+ start:59983 stop:61440 length:1458 start_codon:yes stop_codon:yes gene_type:complete